MGGGSSGNVFNGKNQPHSPMSRDSADGSVMEHADAPAEDGRAFDGSASGSDNEESPFTGADNGGKSKGVIRAS